MHLLAAATAPVQSHGGVSHLVWGVTAIVLAVLWWGLAATHHGGVPDSHRRMWKTAEWCSAGGAFIALALATRAAM